MLHLSEVLATAAAVVAAASVVLANSTPLAFQPYNELVIDTPVCCAHQDEFLFEGMTEVRIAFHWNLSQWDNPPYKARLTFERGGQLVGQFTGDVATSLGLGSFAVSLPSPLTADDVASNIPWRLRVYINGGILQSDQEMPFENRVASDEHEYYGPSTTAAPISSAPTPSPTAPPTGSPTAVTTTVAVATTTEAAATTTTEADSTTMEADLRINDGQNTGIQENGLSKGKGMGKKNGGKNGILSGGKSGALLESVKVTDNASRTSAQTAALCLLVVGVVGFVGIYRRRSSRADFEEMEYATEFPLQVVNGKMEISPKRPQSASTSKQNLQQEENTPFKLVMKSYGAIF